MLAAGSKRGCSSVHRCMPVHVPYCFVRRGDHYLDKAPEIYVNAFNMVHGE